MNKTNLVRAIFIAAVISVLISSSVTTSRAQITRGGILNVDLASEPTTNDPLTGAWNAGFVGAQIFNSLLTLDSNLKPQPSLATSYAIDSQAGTYSFQLRQGVLWSDGQPFTADDVKFAFENIISHYDVFGAQYFKNVTVTTSGNSVTIKPVNFQPGVQLSLIASADGSIYPKHILNGQDFLKSSFRTTSPIGTGPFALKTWVKGSYIELDRNPNFWNTPKPYLDEIIIKFVGDSSAIIAALQRGEIQYIFRGVPFEAYSTLKQSSSLQVLPYNRPPYVSALWMNMKAQYLSDVNVRRAIAYAVNRNDIVAKATQGLSKTDQYMIDPTIVPPSPNMTIYNYDVAKANSILDQAGYSKGADGNRFTLELLTRSSEPDEQLYAQLVKDELSAVGINISIKTVDFATWLSLNAKFQYQMATVKYWTSTLWAYQLFSTEWIGKGPFTNNFQYSSPVTDNIFHTWLKESDPAKSVKLLQQVEDQISRDLPEVVLYQVVWLNVINTNFKGPNLPVGKWVFFDTLEDTYSASVQATTAATPTSAATSAATSVTSAGGQAFDVSSLATAVIVLVIIVAAGVIWMRRKRPKPQA